MEASIARTILSLNEQRNRLEAEKHQALLDQAEMEHELRMLRSMRQQILGCLLEPRKNRKTEQGARHTVARVARILRNTNQNSKEKE